MTVALKKLLSSIPTLNEAEFAQLVQAVSERMNAQGGITSLNEVQWAEKLDHSLTQARQGQKSDASTLTNRIKAMYGR